MQRKPTKDYGYYPGNVLSINEESQNNKVNPFNFTTYMSCNSPHNTIKYIMHIYVISCQMD